MRNDPLAYLADELKTLQDQGLYRELRVLDGEQASTATFDGKSVVNLSSNNYLGLTTHPKLKAKAKRAKGATVLPVVDLLAPDGAQVVDGVIAKSGRATGSLSATLADGGLFGLRVGGLSGTGGVTFSWSLKPARVPAVRLDPLAGDEQKEYPFPARGGALVSWSVSFRGDGAAQAIRVLDPDGIEVPFDPEDPTYVVRKITSERIKDLPIPADRPGGLLVYGIPGFKLEKDVVQRRTDRLAEGGIVFKLSFEVGRDATLEDLRRQHDAVLLATGVYAAKDLPVPGAGSMWWR